MGASGWTYFTPYQPQPSEALRELQQQVFASGQYQRPKTGQELLNSLQNDSVEMRRKLAESYRNLPGAEDSAEIQSAIDKVEQTAAFAAAVWPRARRLLDAMATGDTSQLAEDELREFNMYPQYLKLCPSVSRRFRQSKGHPRDIDELREEAAEDGTHSIIDIIRISKRKAHGAASPLTEKALLRHFGTPEPTRQQVESSDLAFTETLNWQAVFFAVFHNSEPVEWVFIGSSGD